MAEPVYKEITLTNLRAYVLPREACKDLAQDDPKDSNIYRRRILLLTPGTWNDIDFINEEIQAACGRANDKAKKNNGLYAIPSVNGHNDNMDDVYGKAVGVSYGKAMTSDGEKEGAIFDLECRSDLPSGGTIKKLMDWAPELVRFSARLRGQWLSPKTPQGNYGMVNFEFVHVGTVPDPACTDAGILGELNRKATANESSGKESGSPADFSLSAQSENPEDMATQEDLARLERENAELKAKLSEATNQLKQKDDELAAKDAELAKARKGPVIEGILALHKDADPKFLESMSLEQLAAYKADLEKRGPAAASASTEKSLSAGGQSPGAQTPQELSRKRANAIFGTPKGRGGNA